MDAVNAIRLRFGDWRPLVGLTEAHAGTLVERVIYRVVLDTAREAHEADVRAQQRHT